MPNIAKHAKLFDLSYTFYPLHFCPDFRGHVKSKKKFPSHKSQNDKMSVLIGKIISRTFQKSPSFYSSVPF